MVSGLASAGKLINIATPLASEYLTHGNSFSKQVASLMFSSSGFVLRVHSASLWYCMERQPNWDLAEGCQIFRGILCF